MGKRGPKPRRREIVWSPEFAYGVGLMASDGSLSDDGLHFTFVSKDLEQIEHLKKCFDVTANTSLYSNGRNREKIYYRVQWGDVTLYEYLFSIGLTPNKSLTIGTLRIPDEFFFDYLRGSIDGDGCFYSYFDPRWKSSFMFYLELVSASEEHLLWVREICTRLLGIKGHMTCQDQKTSTLYHLKFAKKEALKVLHAMYPNNSVMCLSRKRLKIERALGIVGLSLPR